MHPLILYAAVREEHARRGRQARLERLVCASRAGDAARPTRTGAAGRTGAVARLRAAAARLIDAALGGRTRVA